MIQAFIILLVTLPFSFVAEKGFLATYGSAYSYIPYQFAACALFLAFGVLLKEKGRGRILHALGGFFFSGLSGLIGAGLTLYVFFVLFTDVGLLSGLKLTGRYPIENVFGKMALYSISGFTLVMAAFMAIGELVTALKVRPRQPTGLDVLRGRKVLSGVEAKEIASKKYQDVAKKLFFGWLELPLEASLTHFLAVGSTGAGKTITIRVLMQSLLPLIAPNSGKRAVIYDAKQDMLSIIKGINPDVKVRIFNPFDKRSCAWDMAKDITAPATAQQIASILIPENKKASQPFFDNASRHLLSGVMIAFIKKGSGKWTFRDVLIACKTRERLIKVLSQTRETSDLVSQYLDEETTSKNILSTLASRLQRYEFIASMWEKSEEKLSLRDFLKEESILLLGNDEATRTALDAINQVIFKRLSELLLSEEETDTPGTFIFLDEVREAGRLDGLSSLLTKGRSKGVSLTLGFQDIEGLREVYGKEVAHEIIGMVSNKALLKMDSPETARWASSLFGEMEVREWRTSHSTGASKSSGSTSGFKNYSSNSGTSTSSGTNTSEHRLKKEALLPSEFLSIPPTTPETGLTGFYLVPLVGAYSATMQGWRISEILKEKAEVKNIDPRPDEDQYLDLWSIEDEIRLGLIAQDSITLINSDPDREIDTTTGDKEDFGILTSVKREKLRN